MHSLKTFARRWGLILIGILFIVCGLIYGAIPQKTPYQSITKAFMAHYLSGRGMGYMQLEKSPTLYLVNEGEFLPAFSADYLNHGNILISFLYRTDETTNIDANADNNVHLVGPAFTVERITLYHRFGQQPITFSTHDILDVGYISQWVIRSRPIMSLPILRFTTGEAKSALQTAELIDRFPCSLVHSE